MSPRPPIPVRTGHPPVPDPTVPASSVPGSPVPAWGYRRALGGRRNWGLAGWGLRRRLHTEHPHLPARVIRAAITAARGVSAGLGVHHAPVVERLARARLTVADPTPGTPTPAAGHRDG